LYMVTVQELAGEATVAVSQYASVGTAALAKQ